MPERLVPRRPSSMRLPIASSCTGTTGVAWAPEDGTPMTPIGHQRPPNEPAPHRGPTAVSDKRSVTAAADSTSIRHEAPRCLLGTDGQRPAEQSRAAR